MSESSIIAVAMFQSYQEASIAQAALAAEGIDSEIAGGVIADTLAYFGSATGGVRLLVSEQDAARASEVLDSRTQGRLSPAPAWQCPDCGEEVEGDFDLCWSCGRARSEDDVAAAQTAGDSRAQPIDAMAWREEADAARSIEDENRASEDSESAEALVDRAWKAAVLGIVLFPLLVYALVLLLHVSRIPPAHASWKFYASLLIVAGMALLWWELLPGMALLWWDLLRGFG
jgi:hypothetical protein